MKPVTSTFVGQGHIAFEEAMVESYSIDLVRSIRVEVAAKQHGGP